MAFSTSLKEFSGYRVLAFASMLLLFFLFFFYTTDIGFLHQQPIAEKGVFDLSGWDFEKQGIVELKGEWEFYWKSFIEPGQEQIKDPLSGYIKTPGNWNNYELSGMAGGKAGDKPDTVNKKVSKYGFATYRLRVIPGKKDSFALKIRNMRTAYRLYINGDLISEIGRVGTSAKTSVPRFFPQIVKIPKREKEYEILLHISNYDFRAGGLADAIWFGLEIDVRLKREGGVARVFFLFGSFFIMGLYHLGLYILRKNDSSSLYFCILILAYSVKVLLEREYYFVSFFPDLPWEHVITVEYLSFYISLPFFYYFIASLFPEEFNRLISYAIGIIGVSAILFVLVTPVKLNSIIMPPYHVYITIVGIYIIAMAFRAYNNKRDGAGIFLAGILIVFLAMVNDILYNNKFINTGFVGVGGLYAFFFLQSFLLSHRYNMTFVLVDDQREKLVKADVINKRELNDRRRAERELRKSEANYRSIFENAQTGIFRVNEKGRLLNFNPAFSKSTGISYDVQLDRNPINFFDMIPESQDKMVFIDSLENDGVVNGYEFCLEKDEGEKTYFNLRVQSVFDDEFKFLCYEGMVEDVTEKKKTEELKRLKDEAEALARSKSEFLARMSHEIRTPMNAIMGMAEVLEETNLDKNQRQFVKVLSSAGGGLLSFINDVLDISKHEAGKMVMEKVPFQLDKLVENICEVMKVRGYKKGLFLKQMIHPKTPLNLMGDPYRLRQILVNLIDNAIKFTDSGGVTIIIEPSAEYENHSDEKDAVEIFLSIKDTGIGIREDKLQIIFDSFSQADDTITRKYGGTGLGLGIARKLSEMMGGYLDVVSKPGEGSTFYFSAKFILVNEDEKTHEDGKQQKQKEIPSLSDLRLLLVDDSENNRFVVKTYLGDTNVEIISAVNGQEGFEQFKSQEYDIVLLDMQMPVMDGYTMAEEVRKWEKEKGLSHTPIIAMTAFAHDTDAEKCLNAGCDVHLTKPVSREELFAAIRYLFEKQFKGEELENIATIEERIKNLAPKFLVSVANEIQKMYLELEKENYDKISIHGHMLKGEGEAWGFPEITRMSAKIQELVKTNDLEEIKPALDALSEYTNEMISNLVS